MDGFEWVVIDTETNGLSSPVHVVEIAARRMRGWERSDEGFGRLINHGVPIDPQATAVHGYTNEYVRKWGEDPLEVYEELRLYIEDRPIVAYNLSFDERVLTREWERLGIPAIGTRGFCALRLAKRLLDPSPAGNHQLQTLKTHFGLPDRKAHSALGDVETTIDLMESVLWPIARSQGLSNWEDIRGLADRKPSSARSASRKRPAANSNPKVSRPVSGQITGVNRSSDSGPRGTRENETVNITFDKNAEYNQNKILNSKSVLEKKPNIEKSDNFVILLAVIFFLFLIIFLWR